MLLRVFEKIGNGVIGFMEEMGGVLLLLFKAIIWAFRPPFRLHRYIAELYSVGVGSLFIVLLTGAFCGAVFGLQSAFAFSLFNAESLTGSTVALSLTRELAPVFSGLMVAGRTGSAMATELGSMKVTEQVDAIATMAVDPVQYLVTPRLFASIAMLPILCLLFNAVGLLGAYIVTVELMGLDQGVFFGKIRQYVDPSDINIGLIKAAVFGLIIGIVGCYKGISASGGARGVGEATTRTVVVTSVAILISDYFLTLVLLD